MPLKPLLSSLSFPSALWLHPWLLSQIRAADVLTQCAGFRTIAQTSARTQKTPLNRRYCIIGVTGRDSWFCQGVLGQTLPQGKSSLNYGLHVDRVGSLNLGPTLGSAPESQGSTT